jgi:hypothetical protein
MPKTLTVESIDHFDTCLSCYVTDWSGVVIQAAVDGSTRMYEVKEELRTEFRNRELFEFDEIMHGWTTEQHQELNASFERALDALFSSVNPLSCFSKHLEKRSEIGECDELCYAFFRVNFSTDTNPDTSSSRS